MAPKTTEEIAAALGVKDRWIYLAVGQNIWAKGFSRTQALDGLKEQNGGRKVDRWILYAVADPWAVITGMGDIEYTPRATGAPAEYVEVERLEPKAPKQAPKHRQG